MKNWIFIFSGFLFLSIGNLFAQNNSVMIEPTDSISHLGPRSIVDLNTPLVTLDGTVLTFDFSPATVSQIVIMDENNQNQVVYSESFTSSTQVVVDLENEGIGKGTYLLWLFAYGEWWEGEFEIEN